VCASCVIQTVVVRLFLNVLLPVMLVGNRTEFFVACLYESAQINSGGWRLGMHPSGCQSAHGLWYHQRESGIPTSGMNSSSNTNANT
jgi:hypothetical protein